MIQESRLLWAKYQGIGSFSKRRWHNGLRWHAIAYWPDEAAPWPAVIDLSLRTLHLGPHVEALRLQYFEGLAGSHPRFTGEWVRGGALLQRSATVTVSLKYSGRRGDEVELTGEWQEKGRGGVHQEAILLQGSPLALGRGALPADGEPEADVGCNVQHLALPLETLIKKLADGRSLDGSQAQTLRDCVEQYQNGSCGSRRCTQSSCSLRQPLDWLHFLRYKDVRDVLDTPKSGLDSEPPQLRTRAGVETLALTALQRPGHYNP